MKLSKMTKKINELDEFYAEVEGDYLYIRQKSDGDYFVRFNLRSNDLYGDGYIDGTILAQRLNDGALEAFAIIRKYLNERENQQKYILPLGVDRDGDANYLVINPNGLNVSYGSDQSAYTQEELDAAKKQFPALATLIEDIKKEEK